MSKARRKVSKVRRIRARLRETLHPHNSRGASSRFRGMKVAYATGSHHRGSLTSRYYSARARRPELRRVPALQPALRPYAGSRPGVCGAREYAASPSRSARGETGLQVPNGFTIETIASIGGARELAALPNGDLIVGTDGSNVYIVPDAEGAAATPQVFAAIDDSLADGVAFTAARCEIYVATENHVWRIPYHGERKASER